MIQVEHWCADQEGSLTEQAFRKKLKREGYHVSRYVYSPGTVFPTDTHGLDKKDAVLQGRLRITKGKDEIILGPGDCVVVPSGVVHNAELVGDQPVVALDATKGYV